MATVYCASCPAKRMRSQCSDEDIWSGICVSGDLPSLRTVTRARTAISCVAGRRWTSILKSVKVTASRSASVAVGASTDWPLGAFCCAPGPTVVVVWPFSSVEREKITCPLWGSLCGAAGGFCEKAGNAAQTKMLARNRCFRRLISDSLAKNTKEWNAELIAISREFILRSRDLSQHHCVLHHCVGQTFGRESHWIGQHAAGVRPRRARRPPRRRR